MNRPTFTKLNFDLIGTPFLKRYAKGGKRLKSSFEAISRTVEGFGIDKTRKVKTGGYFVMENLALKMQCEWRICQRPAVHKVRFEPQRFRTIDIPNAHEAQYQFEEIELCEIHLKTASSECLMPPFVVAIG